MVFFQLKIALSKFNRILGKKIDPGNEVKQIMMDQSEYTWGFLINFALMLIKEIKDILTRKVDQHIADSKCSALFLCSP